MKYAELGTGPTGHLGKSGALSAHEPLASLWGCRQVGDSAPTCLQAGLVQMACGQAPCRGCTCGKRTAEPSTCPICEADSIPGPHPLLVFWGHRAENQLPPPSLFLKRHQVLGLYGETPTGCFLYVSGPCDKVGPEVAQPL